MHSVSQSKMMKDLCGQLKSYKMLTDEQMCIIGPFIDLL